MSSAPPPGMASFACVSAAWQAHEGELRKNLRHRAAHADTADDLLQDVFVKAKRQGQGCCSLDNPRARLYQVARNALVGIRCPVARASPVLPAGGGGDHSPQCRVTPSCRSPSRRTKSSVNSASSR